MYEKPIIENYKKFILLRLMVVISNFKRKSFSNLRVLAILNVDRYMPAVPTSP